MEPIKYLVHKKVGGAPPESGVPMKPKPKAITRERPLMDAKKRPKRGAWSPSESGDRGRERRFPFEGDGNHWNGHCLQLMVRSQNRQQPYLHTIK